MIDEISSAMANGLLVAISGIDGSGKSSLIAKLDQYYRKKGYSTHITKQPTERFRKSEERKAYLQFGERSIWPESLALLAAYDIYWHIQHEVLPMLDTGRIVISDRYVSGFMSAFYCRGVSTSWLRTLSENSPQPHLELLLDCPADLAKERITRRDGDLDEDDSSVQTLDRKRRSLLALRSESCVVVDARDNADRVLQTCTDRIDGLLAKTKLTRDTRSRT